MGRLEGYRSDMSRQRGRASARVALGRAHLRRRRARRVGRLFTDLRERLHMEERLAAAQQELRTREKQAIIAELAGAAAHELNQPLTSVMGYAELSKRRLDGTRRPSRPPTSSSTKPSAWPRSSARSARSRSTRPRATSARRRSSISTRPAKKPNPQSPSTHDEATSEAPRATPRPRARSGFGPRVAHQRVRQPLRSEPRGRTRRAVADLPRRGCPSLLGISCYLPIEERARGGRVRCCVDAVSTVFPRLTFGLSWHESDRQATRRTHAYRARHGPRTRPAISPTRRGSFPKSTYERVARDDGRARSGAAAHRQRRRAAAPLAATPGSLLHRTTSPRCSPALAPHHAAGDRQGARIARAKRANHPVREAR